jgi:hypothetical protein
MAAFLAAEIPTAGNGMNRVAKGSRRAVSPRTAPSSSSSPTTTSNA